MKRRTLSIIGLTVLLLLILSAGAVIALAKAAPFHPGQALFRLQNGAEHWAQPPFGGPEKRAAYALDLLDRRLADLKAAAGTFEETAALTAVNTELDHTLLVLQTVTNDSQGVLRDRLIQNLRTLKDGFPQLTLVSQVAAQDFEVFQAKIIFLKMLALNSAWPLADLENYAGLSAQDISSTSAPTASKLQKIILPTRNSNLFPPGTKYVLHTPLTGIHGDMGCASCHTVAGQAVTVPGDQCRVCHSQTAPANHYAVRCSLCHIPKAWIPAQFDHPTTAAADCQSCHLKHKPADHYVGQCSICHQPGAWLPASFDHASANASDCRSCHAQNAPANHYSAQCSSCHATSGWLPKNFNHQAAGASDCRSCHAQNAPTNHYSAQCSSCHATSGWLPTNFNHQAAGASDCRSCHAQNAPTNHYSAQCSSCHATSGWLPVNFNHQAAGASDCRSCHAKNAPANHFSAQCSSCHATSGWLPAKFNHQAAGATNCVGCHAGKRPANHFDGQCSSCHNTNAWKPANFNHTFPTNHGGAGGVCAKCHPSGGSAWTCFTCHNQNDLASKHNEEGIPDYASRCMDCHANGQKPGDD